MLVLAKLAKMLCSTTPSFVVPYKAKAVPGHKFHAKAEENDARTELLLPEIRRQALRCLDEMPREGSLQCPVA